MKREPKRSNISLRTRALRARVIFNSQVRLTRRGIAHGLVAVSRSLMWARRSPTHLIAWGTKTLRRNTRLRRLRRIERFKRQVRAKGHARIGHRYPKRLVQWRYLAWAVSIIIGASVCWYSFLADFNAWLAIAAPLANVVSGAAVVIGLINFLGSRRETRLAERKATAYRAWQTINSAQGKPGNGGRLEALLDLARHREVLDGVNLDGAWLSGIDLSGASLFEAKFRPIEGVAVALVRAQLRRANLMKAQLPQAKMFGASLQGAKLNSANLEGANLRETRLDGANLSRAQLTEADLLGASLRGANVGEANLTGACLRWSRLEGANFSKAVFRGADLIGTQVQGTDLRGAQLQGAILGLPTDGPKIRPYFSWDERTIVRGTNIFGIVNAPNDFREWALTHGAIESCDTIPDVGFVSEDQLESSLPGFDGSTEDHRTPAIPDSVLTSASTRKPAVKKQSFDVKAVDDEQGGVSGVEVILEYTTLLPSQSERRITGSDGLAAFSDCREGEVELFFDGDSYGLVYLKRGYSVILTMKRYLNGAENYSPL